MNFEPGIIMDILAAVILIFSLIRGAQKGLALTLLSFMQWFICIFAGFFLCTYAKEYIINHTNLDEQINSHILNQISTTIEESMAYLAIPDLFSEWIRPENAAFVYGTSASLTNVLLTVLAFIGVIIVVKVLCSIAALFFSKKYQDGLIVFLDGFAGFLFGAVRGILLVFIFFVILIPVLTFLPAELAEPVKTALDQSHVASFLYDDNILLILVRDLFS